MDIYVESRGFAQDDDYCWLKVAEASQERLEKEDLPAILQSAFQLIDSESFSVVLSRQDDKLLLLITGIEPDGKVDFVERQIRISVAWIAENNEAGFRLLAANALDEEKCQILTAKLSQAVTLGGETGFQVDYLKILELSDRSQSQELPGNELPNPTKQIAQISPERKKELSEELKQYRLPDKSGLLVVVTEIKKQETLVNANVWRGLSSLVKDKDWREIPAIYADNSHPNKFVENLTRLATILGIMGVIELLFKAFNIVAIDKSSHIGNTDPSKHL